tara:strand:+ start:18329 stop:19819 length:1491 start_codon:yes stop_codon:yes gene_type:complete
MNRLYKLNEQNLMQNKILNRSLLLFLVIWALVGTKVAVSQDIQKGQEISLDQMIEMAIANSPEIKRALLAVKDADQLVKIAYGEVFPDVTSSISYTKNIEIPVNYIPAKLFDPTAPDGLLAPVEFGTDNNWQGGFTVEQNLFKGEALVGISSSTVFKLVQQENFRAISQQIITQVRVAYYSVLAANEQLRLQQAQIDRLDQNIKENEVRAKAGIIDEYDVLRLKVQLSNQTPLLVQAKYALAEAYRTLKVISGLPNTFDFKVKGNLNSFDILSKDANNTDNLKIKEIDRMNPFEFSALSVDPADLVAYRGDLRVIDATIGLKDKEITAVKSRFLPTLTASYNLQWSAAEPGAPTFFENSNRFQTFGLNLSFPLFQGFERVANVNRANIQRKDLEEQKRATFLTANNEVASASEKVNETFETSNARKAAVSLAKDGYERAKRRFENGLGSQLELTEAEIQVREAEVNYAIMVFNYLSAKAQYDLATGMVPFVDTTRD